MSQRQSNSKLNPKSDRAWEVQQQAASADPPSLVRSNQATAAFAATTGWADLEASEAQKASLQDSQTEDL